MLNHDLPEEYAFISYSHVQKAFADTLKQFLNKNGIQTWMAPGDIPPGSKYAAVINHAVRDCSCFLLVLSNDSQNSQWVEKEVERAINYRKTLIPIKIEDMTLNDQFEFYISTDQIIAMQSIDEQSPDVKRLLNVIISCMKNPPARQEKAVREKAPEQGSTAPAGESPRIRKLREAANRGNAEAQYKLGVACEYGKGTAKDLSEAVSWFRKAAEQGFADGQAALGTAYHFGNGVKADHAEAVRWYRKAAEQGQVRAQYNLAVAYHNGQGVQKSYEEAVRWYRAAAEQGYAAAQFFLGTMYVNGQGVEKDEAEGAGWYRLAAEQDYAAAQYYLGQAYDFGLGVEENIDEAIRWYGKAAEQDYPGAAQRLAALGAAGSSV